MIITELLHTNLQKVYRFIGTPTVQQIAEFQAMTEAQLAESPLFAFDRDYEQPMPVVVERSQKEKYEFLKNLMLEVAGELSKEPALAFALKSDVENLKFWVELGAAETVIAILQAMPDNEVFTADFKTYLVNRINEFLHG
jgi:hypothetical protein